MSKLDKILEVEKPPKKTSTKIIRNRRARPMHPEAIQAALEARPPKPVPVGPTPYGWTVILYLPNGRKLTRDTSPLATYDEAKALMTAEMTTGDYEKAWLVRKTEP